MTELALNPVPARRTVALEQLRNAVLGRRWSILALGVACSLVAGEQGWFWARTGVGVDLRPDGGTRFVTTVSRAVPQVFGGFPVLLCLALVWAVTVWSGERGARDDHYSMPVSDAEHDLWRVAAGAAWLLVALETALLGGIALDFLRGDAGSFARVSPLAWTGFFTGPLTLFLLGSAVAITTRHPGRWLGCLFLLDMLLFPACLASGACRASGAFGEAVTSAFGLNIAVVRPVHDALANPSLIAFARGAIPARFPLPADFLRIGPAALAALMAGWLLLSAAAVLLAARYRPRL